MVLLIQIKMSRDFRLISLNYNKEITIEKNMCDDNSKARVSLEKNISEIVSQFEVHQEKIHQSLYKYDTPIEAYLQKKGQ